MSRFGLRDTPGQDFLPFELRSGQALRTPSRFAGSRPQNGSSSNLPKISNQQLALSKTHSFPLASLTPAKPVALHTFFTS
jgi:hypothetical protein